jgi:formate hydrogenlyase transcriptional activator
MESGTHSSAHLVRSEKEVQNESALFSSQSVLDILRMILAGAPLAEVLTIIARLVESRGDGTLCTIWLPDNDRSQLHCAAAPSLPGFIAGAGSMLIGPQGGSCGTAVYRREPVYVTDILTDPVWDVYRNRLLPFGIRAVWSRPLFTDDGKVLGTFAIHYREARSPETIDLQLIESAGHIAGIAIERHLNEEKLRYERDRLRLLLEITTSVTSRLDLRQVVEGLSTNLFSIMRCDVSALLLPDSESGELSVSILYNPDARGPFREGSLVPMNGSISGQVLRKGKSIRIDNFEQVREDPEMPPQQNLWVDSGSGSLPSE